MQVFLHILVQQHQKRKSKMVTYTMFLYKAEECFDHVFSNEITCNFFKARLAENFLSFEEKRRHSHY